VTIDLTGRGIRAVILDIEGTTTPMAFVAEVLFPFARAHLREFLESPRHAEDMAEVVRRLSAEHAADLHAGAAPPRWAPSSQNDRDGLPAYVEWLMDRDRKSPGLKLLQGLIWQRGYQAGQLRGQVYPDVPPAIRRWRAAGVMVAIYSSGSELAQRRLFESTPAGDLTPLLSGFFDTSVGAKTSVESYARIAERLGQQSGACVFISDVTMELTAAKAAGFETALSLRPGNAIQPDAAGWRTIHTFDGIIVGP
jgi:enolase-phosphatase E1